MDFKTFWSRLSTSQKVDFAIQVESKTGYLSQVANGHANPGPALRHRMKDALPRGTLIPHVSVRKPEKAAPKPKAKPVKKSARARSAKR